MSFTGQAGTDADKKDKRLGFVKKELKTPKTKLERNLT